jgi:hypothetical protein
MSDNEGNVLFDPTVYGEVKDPRRKRGTNVAEHVEPLVPPWVLLANRHGVIGFHVPKAPPDHNATVIASCGVKGHVVSPPEKMVRCPGCEAEQLTVE